MAVSSRLGYTEGIGVKDPYASWWHLLDHMHAKEGILKIGGATIKAWGGLR